MNAIKITPKTVVIIPAREKVISDIKWRTTDDPFNNKLSIVVNDSINIVIEGPDYSQLGQWSDDTIKNIIERLQLEVTQ